MGFFFQPFVGLSAADAMRDAVRAQVALYYQMIAERNLAADRAAATEFRRRALAHGTLDEVVRIISPPVKRKRGRQSGSRSEAFAARRDALWCAYQYEKSKSPNAPEAEIAQDLFAKGGRAYGNSPPPSRLRSPRSRRTGMPLHSLVALGTRASAADRKRRQIRFSN
jgi:hypothetical protein